MQYITSIGKREGSQFHYLQVSSTKIERCPVARVCKMARYICLNSKKIKLAIEPYIILIDKEKINSASQQNKHHSIQINLTKSILTEMKSPYKPSNLSLQDINSETKEDNQELPFSVRIHSSQRIHFLASC